MAKDNVVYVDTETTGLITGIHQPIEYAHIHPGPEVIDIYVPELDLHIGNEFQCYINFEPDPVPGVHNGYTWDPGAENTHRIPRERALTHGYTVAQFLHILKALPHQTFGKGGNPGWVLAGFNPAFDLYMLRQWDRGVFSFYTHDVNAIAHFAVGTSGSKYICAALGITTDPNLKHSAPYDCALAQACNEGLYRMRDENRLPAPERSRNVHRDYALEQSVSLLVSNDFELIAGRPSDYPELAEWLRNREK